MRRLREIRVSGKIMPFGEERKTSISIGRGLGIDKCLGMLLSVYLGISVVTIPQFFTLTCVLGTRP